MRTSERGTDVRTYWVYTKNFLNHTTKVRKPFLVLQVWHSFLADNFIKLLLHSRLHVGHVDHARHHQFQAGSCGVHSSPDKVGANVDHARVLNRWVSFLYAEQVGREALDRR